MKTGAAISGLAHAAVIAVVIIGVPWFPARERPPIPVADVSFVTESDFDRAQAAARAPRDEAAPPEPPRGRPAAPAEPVAEPPPAAEEAPPAPAEPAPEPEVTTLVPEFNPDSPLATPAPDAPPPAPTDLAAVAPPRQRTAITPRPAPPAPSAIPEEPGPEPPAPDLEPDPEPTPEPPTPEPPTPAPPTPAEPAPTLAPETSTRPLGRRGNIETAAAPSPPPPPAEAEPAPDAPATSASDLVRQLREQEAREASATPPTEPTPPTPASDGDAATTSLPSGPPITGAERDGLVLAVQRCWSLPAGLRDAGELKVTVGAQLNPDGSVAQGSVRLIEPNPVPDARFQRAYDAGRRALLRCAPYTSLPREKYAQWRDLEVVFNPEGMISW